MDASRALGTCLSNWRINRSPHPKGWRRPEKSGRFFCGRSITYGYDDDDRVVSIVDSDGPNILNTYDAMGRLLTRAQVSGTKFQTTEYSWDGQDRIRTITDPMGRVTRYNYEKNRVWKHPESIVDPAGRVTRFKYDSLGRLTEKTDPKGDKTYFEYDLRGDLISVTDAIGNRTTYTYDGRRRKVGETRPSIRNGEPYTAQIEYAYDDADRLVSETHLAAEGAHRTIQFEYDDFGRVKKRKLLVGETTEDEAHYTYEPQLDANLVKTLNNGAANLGFTNGATPPFAITGYSVEEVSGNPLGLIEDTFTITRDVTGNIASVTGSSSGEVFTKSYDPAGRLVEFNVREGTLKGAISYDGSGRKEKVSYSDGTSGHFSFDKLNRAIGINWKEKYKDSVKQQLTYDLAGNVVRMAREHSTYDLSYDPADQLVKSVFKGLQGVPGYNREFGYDAVGNRLSDSQNGAGSFVSNFLTQNGASSFTSSQEGFGEVAQEVTGDKVKNYIYRADGKIASFSSGNLAVNYHYDGLDRLVAKTINDSGNAYTQSFTHLGDENRVLLGKAGDGSMTTYVDGQGPAERLGEVKNGVGKGYITDHLGSVLNSAPAGSWKSYGLFGEPTGKLGVSQTTSPVIYGFTGHMVDAESGLNRTHYRQYDPRVGRWTAQEPTGVDGPHLYHYVFSNPLKYADPTGLYTAIIVGPDITDRYNPGPSRTEDSFWEAMRKAKEAQDALDREFPDDYSDPLNQSSRNRQQILNSCSEDADTNFAKSVADIIKRKRNRGRWQL